MTLYESQSDGTHKVITVTLDNYIETEPLIDFGARRFTFIDKNFVVSHNLSRYKLKILRTVEMIDERELEDGDIEHLIRLSYRINNHWEEHPIIGTRLGHNLLVLGIY